MSSFGIAVLAKRLVERRRVSTERRSGTAKCGREAQADRALEKGELYRSK
jgi:hypothetical protein